MKRSILYVAAMAALASCSEADFTEVTPEVAPETKQMTISVALPTDGTRVAVDEDNGWKCSWEEGDVLWAWSAVEDPESSIKLEMTGSPDGGSATFSGDVPSFSYSLIYIGSDDISSLSSYVLTAQREGADKPYLQSTVMFDANAEAQSVTMSHLYTYIDLDMAFGTDFNGATIESVVCSGLKTDETTKNPITITDGVTTVADGIAKIQFCAFPTTLVASDILTITAKLSKEGVYSTWSTVIPANNDFAFVAGQYHPVLCTMENTTEANIYSGAVSTFSAESVPAQNIWVVTDSEIVTDNYAGLKAALAAAKGAGRSIELIFPNLTEVAIKAFYKCPDFTSISMPKVKTVGSHAFVWCDALETVDMPEATTFGNLNFYFNYNDDNDNVLKSVSLPKATTFGNNCFYDCDVLESVSLPEATTFGYNCFGYCDALKSVSLPEAITFGEECFQYCTALETLSLPKATTLGYSFAAHCYVLKSISLPEATTIGYSFLSCYNNDTPTLLESVSLPKVTTLGTSAFKNRDALKSVSLGADGTGVTSIGKYFFKDAIPGNVDLTVNVGADADYTIADNRITINDSTTTFKSINGVKE